MKKWDVSQSFQVDQIPKLRRNNARELVCFKGTVWKGEINQKTYIEIIKKA